MHDVKKCRYCPEPYERSVVNVEVEFDLPNYAKKAKLKGATSISTSTLPSKTDLSRLKTKVDNLDVDKLN